MSSTIEMINTPLFPITYVVGYQQKVIKRVSKTYEVSEEEFFKRYASEQGSNKEIELDIAEETKAKFYALPRDKQEDVIRAFQSDCPLISGNSHDWEDLNHLDGCDEDTEYEESVRDDDDTLDGEVEAAFWDCVGWCEELSNAILNPADLRAKVIADAEGAIKKADDEFLQSAEHLKHRFMKEMKVLREQTEKRQEVLRKQLADLKVADVLASV
jgi:hypothetical protein